MLVGIVDPRHSERKLDASGRFPRWMPRELLLAEAEGWGPRESPWPYELLNVALAAVQDRDYYSTTMFTGGCRRGTVVERKEDFILAVDDLYASLRGTLLHQAIEAGARPGSVAEVRFFTEVNDEEVSCTPDLLTADTVWDWKMTENPPQYNYPWPNHKRQLQYNRFIVNNATRWEKDGIPYELGVNPWEWRFEHLVAVYLGPKGPKVLEVEESVQVPKVDGKGTKAKRLPEVWTDEFTYAELGRDLEGMSAALRMYPEWPAGLEDYPGWAGPPSWRCPGIPLCYLPNCLAKRWPDMLTWDSP